MKIAAVADLPPVNEAKEFACEGKEICVANVNGTISAMDNACLHHGGPLGQGVIEGNNVVCPWHGWTFDPQTGEATHDRSAKVRVYPIKVENGDVLVEM
jgi:nitrite reductase (NADH) small subunit